MKDKKVLSPISDYLFKLIFYDEDDKDEILKMLLVDCIGFDNRQVSEITLLDRTEVREHNDDKLVILDIKAKLSDGTFVNIEVQKLDKGNFIKRSAFYTCRVYGKQAIKGMDYNELKQTVSLNIVDFDLFTTDNNFYRSFYLEDNTNNIRLEDIIRMDFLELTKIKTKIIDKNDKRALWGLFFNAKTEGDLDMIKEINNSFEKPTEKLKRLSSDPRVLTQYEEEQKVLADQRSWKNHIKREAVIEGKIEVAQNMLTKGYTLEQIKDITGLDESDIKELT